MAVKQWNSDDPGYENWISQHQSGFVANTNSPPTEKYFLIHSAKHKLPDRSSALTANPRTGHRYSKITADTVAQLINWAKENIPGFNEDRQRIYCKVCMSAHGSQHNITGDKETLLDELIQADPTGYLIKTHENLIDKGILFKGPKNSRTLLYYFRNEKNEIGIAAIRNKNGHLIFSFPAPYWDKKPKAIDAIFSRIDKKFIIPKTKKVGSSQYSAGQILINHETMPLIARIIEENIIPCAQEDGFYPTPAEDTDISAKEGDKKLKSHTRRERNPKLAKAKLDQMRSTHQRLFCEACQADLVSRYGSHGEGAYQVHHTIPLGKLNTSRVTRLQDLAVLCANCHAFIHRTNPMWSIPDLAAHLNKSTNSD